MQARSVDGMATHLVKNDMGFVLARQERFANSDWTIRLRQFLLSEAES